MVDGGSHDDTVKIARKAGAQVHGMVQATVTTYPVSVCSKLEHK